MADGVAEPMSVIAASPRAIFLILRWKGSENSGFAKPGCEIGEIPSFFRLHGLESGMHLNDAVEFMDEILRPGEVRDFPNALNGLQCANSGGFSLIGAAVDACEATIREAAQAGVDLLIVHHGLFWGGLGPWTGATHRKMRILVDADMAVYSSHLPLDLHPEIGNNVILGSRVGFGAGEPFFFENGQAIGLRYEEEVSREVLRGLLEKAVGGPVHLAPGGPVLARRIGVVTGGAGGQVAKAAAEGVDTFVTGEGPHWSFTAAEELGVNLFYAGHYATETFGVKALADRVAGRFAMPWKFIDHPTGL
jgi:dinuclear metal center YbgI/SA1388 family protein